MNRSDFHTYASVLALTIAVTVGFFFVFNKISSLETSIKNLELQSELQRTDTETSTEPVVNTPFPTSTPDVTPTPKTSGIPTAIITKTLSSPNLQPQTTLTVSIESVARSQNGTVLVALKAFTSDATAYSAFDPATVVSVIDLEGNETATGTVSGVFDSIPPKSAASGFITFKTNPMNSTVILQIGDGENPKFYEFNFSKMTYRETTVG